MPDDTDIHVDTDRVRRHLDDLWEIGRTKTGGVTRLAYSEAETTAIEYVLEQLPDEYAVHTDPIGNVFATTDPDADRSIYVGSHLDSVYNGGKLDGALGVVAAMEAVEAVRRHDSEPPCPPTLTIFRAEESARFGRHTIGSRGALGRLQVDDLSATDENDVPLWQAMRRAGYHPENLSEPTIDLDRVAGFLELHIEQGRVLDDADEEVGVVTSVRAPVRYRLTVHGDDDHSGATPMGLRRDAVAGAAEMIGAIEEIGTAVADEGDLVATVGDVSPVDGAINKVCGEVSFPLDVRSTDTAVRDEAERRILDAIERIAEERELTVEREELDRSDPVSLDPGFADVLDASAAAAGAAYRRLPSGGGHDAMNFQLAGIPTGMLFVPSVDGVSHNPAEETDPDAIEAATASMARALLSFDPEETQRTG